MYACFFLLICILDDELGCLGWGDLDDDDERDDDSLRVGEDMQAPRYLCMMGVSPSTDHAAPVRGESSRGWGKAVFDGLRRSPHPPVMSWNALAHPVHTSIPSPKTKTQGARPTAWSGTHDG